MVCLAVACHRVKVQFRLDRAEGIVTAIFCMALVVAVAPLTVGAEYASLRLFGDTLALRWYFLLSRVIVCTLLAIPTGIVTVLVGMGLNKMALKPTMQMEDHGDWTQHRF
jgi:hypothetical protein